MCDKPALRLRLRNELWHSKEPTQHSSTRPLTLPTEYRGVPEMRCTWLCIPREFRIRSGSCHEPLLDPTGFHLFRGDIPLLPTHPCFHSPDPVSPQPPSSWASSSSPCPPSSSSCAPPPSPSSSPPYPQTSSPAPSSSPPPPSGKTASSLP